MATLLKRPGSPNFYVVWHEGGRQHWRTTGTADPTLAERALEEIRALAAGRRREDRIRTLIETAGKVVTTAVGLPIDKLWDDYTRQPVRRMAARTLCSKRQHVEHWVTWMTQHHSEVRAVHEVSERLCLEYVRSLDRHAGQTRNNALSALRSVWDALRIPLGLSCNPWAAVPRAEAQHARREALTLDQVRALYVAAVARQEPFWPAAVAIGYHTGLRWGDVCTLDWSELDLAAKTLRLLPNKGQRHGRAVEFRLPEDVLRHLPANPGRRSAGFVWPEIADQYGRGDQKLSVGLRELFASAGIRMTRPAEAGETRQRAVQVYGFHSLRHTYVTLLEDAGVARETIQSLVGHGSPMMTEHYSHSDAPGRTVAGKLPTLQGKRKKN